MKLVFLLVVVVNGEPLPNEGHYFHNVYACNGFARSIEIGSVSPNDRRTKNQQRVTAYCVPRRVTKNTPAIN